MPSYTEIIRSIYGAWRIARMDPEALKYFNVSIEGFWRSFFAILIVAPFFLLSRSVADSSFSPDAENILGKEGYDFLIFRIGVFIVGWISFPILMVPLARLLNLSSTYVPYIIAWNWSTVVASIFLLPASLIVGYGLMPDNLAGFIFMVIYVTILFYGYLVARSGLGCSAVTAIAIVLIDFLLSLLIGAGAEHLSYSGDSSG